jgi:hypothetical protein
VPSLTFVSVALRQALFLTYQEIDMTEARTDASRAADIAKLRESAQ